MEHNFYRNVLNIQYFVRSRQDDTVVGVSTDSVLVHYSTVRVILFLTEGC